MLGQANPIIRNTDWDRAFRAGRDLALEAAYRGSTVDDQNIMWALLVEAAKTSSRAYPSPPRTGYPAKSSLPEAGDDISYWAKVMAYIQGETTEEPEMISRPPLPSAEQITRAEAVLFLWHHHALTRKGNRSIIKRGVYLKACGVREKRIVATTGLSRTGIHRAKEEGMRDMLEVITRC